VDVIGFQKIFGLCCLKCHIVDIWRDVTFVDEAVFVYLYLGSERVVVGEWIVDVILLVMTQRLSKNIWFVPSKMSYCGDMEGASRRFVLTDILY